MQAAQEYCDQAMITLLRNAAINSLKYRTELALVKALDSSITQFENQLETFKTAFSRNMIGPQALPDRDQRRCVHRSSAEEGSADRRRPQPAPRERQGARCDDQEADPRPDDGGEVRTSKAPPLRPQSEAARTGRNRR
ncbi:DUF2130 domain-containing protein [Bradyrhizobium sp. CCBAU 65884]|uniref:DUF2130 domain-containing protein n=1 Tax=Bradyrhizobium sp. CCBAU 65884 TaxID=722477 RepID=UPI003FA48B59